jgi:general secretion pathway protein M
MVVGGGIAAAIIIGWTLIWMPLGNGAASLRESVDDKRRLLASLLRAEAIAAPVSGAGAVDAGTQSLVVLVDRTHREHGLAGKLNRNQPDGADGIRVTFQDASFDALIAWLGALQNDYGVAVENASFNAGRQPGVVSATMVLRRS